MQDHLHYTIARLIACYRMGVINKACAGCVLSNNNSNKKKNLSLLYLCLLSLFQAFTKINGKGLNPGKSSVQRNSWFSVFWLDPGGGNTEQLENVHTSRHEDPEEFNTELRHALLGSRSTGKPKISMKCVLKEVLKLVAK